MYRTAIWTHMANVNIKGNFTTKTDKSTGWYVFIPCWLVYSEIVSMVSVL